MISKASSATYEQVTASAWSGACMDQPGRGGRWYPAHILNDLDGTAFLEEYLFKLIPGTGPYTIYEKDIINQESYILTRRKDYWGINKLEKRYQYNFDKIKVSVVKDNDALEFEKLKKV